MFVNDVLGLCRSNFFTGDVFGTQIPNTLGTFGQVPFGYGLNTTGFNTGFNTGCNTGFNPGFNTAFNTGLNTAFNTGLNTGNFGVAGFHPLYGYLVNRVPQNFVHQGVVPQTLGNVNTLGGQQVHPFFAQQTQFTNPALAQGGIGNVGYGFSPYHVANWNWTSPFGVQSQICR